MSPTVIAVTVRASNVQFPLFWHTFFLHHDTLAKVSEHRFVCPFLFIQPLISARQTRASEADQEAHVGLVARLISFDDGDSWLITNIKRVQGEGDCVKQLRLDGSEASTVQDCYIKGLAFQSAALAPGGGALAVSNSFFGCPGENPRLASRNCTDGGVGAGEGPYEEVVVQAGSAAAPALVPASVPLLAETRSALTAGVLGTGAGRAVLSTVSLDADEASLMQFLVPVGANDIVVVRSRSAWRILA